MNTNKKILELKSKDSIKRKRQDRDDFFYHGTKLLIVQCNVVILCHLLCTVGVVLKDSQLMFGCGRVDYIYTYFDHLSGCTVTVYYKFDSGGLCIDESLVTF